MPWDETAGYQTEIRPTEIDFGPVRRQREMGFVGSGQPLKNFQDSTFDLAVDDRKAFGHRCLAKRQSGESARAGDPLKTKGQ